MHENRARRELAYVNRGGTVLCVVPRASSHLIAITLQTEVEIRDNMPYDGGACIAHTHKRHVKDKLGNDVDVWWKSWEVGYDPADEVDRAVMATRKAVFPLHGLDPYFD